MLTSTDRHPFRFEALSKAHRKLLPDTFGYRPNGSGIVRSLLVQEVSSPSVSLGASGAFSGFSDGASMALMGNAKDGYFDSFDMDLSRSSTIFGASTRVQPKAFNLLMIIKN